jgi:uncharacterized membrane protein YkoI
MPVSAGVISLVAALAAAPAFAANPAQPDVQAQSTKVAKTTLSEAISIAETQVGGTAVSARLEHERGKAMYDVYVLKENKISSVHVSAVDGKVLSTHEVTAHHNGKMHHQEPQHQGSDKS